MTTAKIHFKVATILYGVTSHLDRKKKAYEEISDESQREDGADERTSDSFDSFDAGVL